MEINKVYKMSFSSQTAAGAYFEDIEEGKEKVLVPKENIPYDIELNKGKEYELFLYGDKDGRVVGTLKMPLIKNDEFKFLKVVSVTEIGMFLDWGMKTDLFVSGKDTTAELEEGDMCYTALIVDKKGRTSGTMELGSLLEENGEKFKIDDKVKGIIYDINKDIGAFVAVEGKYSGLVPKNHLFGEFCIGEEKEFRIIKIKEDGKLDLTTREPILQQIDKDADKILRKTKANGGFLPINDDSEPELINDELGISKKAFKRAFGKLLKENIMIQSKTGIKLK